MSGLKAPILDERPATGIIADVLISIYISILQSKTLPRSEDLLRHEDPLHHEDPPHHEDLLHHEDPLREPDTSSQT
ncbi:MAG: hypothetical protein LBK67_04325 [Coriobacteriales bacterium]|jgi:hypothetical protein|nr:hypothetical protein [Coriobacteriales bacterium]